MTMPIVRPTPYYGNAHPCSMYRNGVRLAGYDWQEQGGVDMPFDHTYEDRVDVVALGRSKQDGTPSPSAPVPIISSAGIVRSENAHGDGAQYELPTLRGIPDGAGGWLVRDKAFIERVGGVPHLFKVPNVEYREFDGTEAWWYGEKHNNGYVFALSNIVPAIRIQFPRWLFSHGAPIPGYQSNEIDGCLLYQYGDYRCGIKLRPETVGILETDTGTQRIAKFKALLAAAKAAGKPYAIAYPRLDPGAPIDLGPIDLPSYYHHTRVLVSGDFTPDVTARCRVVDL